MLLVDLLHLLVKNIQMQCQTEESWNEVFFYCMRKVQDCTEVVYDNKVDDSLNTTCHQVLWQREGMECSVLVICGGGWLLYCCCLWQIWQVAWCNIHLDLRVCVIMYISYSNIIVATPLSLLFIKTTSAMQIIIKSMVSTHKMDDLSLPITLAMFSSYVTKMRVWLQ